jgi:hypothetical protein
VVKRRVFKTFDHRVGTIRAAMAAVRTGRTSAGRRSAVVIIIVVIVVVI